MRRRRPTLLGKLRSLTFVTVLINVLIAAVFRVVNNAVTNIDCAIITAVAVLPFLLYLYLLILKLLQLLPLIVLF
jgi:hypothetical protein